ncbi:MAG: ester cyclase [Acidimicrobiia bacterium]|nr:ester cyclase [Acidimicrobiia bacterium]
MSADANKALLERYMEAVWEKGDIDALTDFLHPGFRRHLGPTLGSLDLEGQIERLRGFREAFPDITITPEDVIAEGDLIAFRSTMRGTHRGVFAGLEPTGKRVTVGLVDLIRVADGRFIEQWGGPDMADLVRQLTG